MKPKAVTYRGLIPPINCKLVSEYLTRRLRWYVFEYAGKRGGVIGLSGGVDSSLTVALAVKALGARNVYVLILPSYTTPREDIEDALTIVKMLRIPKENYEIIRIDPILEAFKRSLGSMSRIEEGNIMARIRMIILHQRAYRRNYLVIGTGDKTELLIGYFTKYGDGGVDVLPIGGLYKTHVRQLALYFGIPAKIALKPSSPRFWPGHTAESELGVSYDIIDAILYYIFEEGYTANEVAEKFNIDIKTVMKVLERVKKTQHKKHTPLVFKVGYRDLGSGWHYPLEWF